MSFMCPARNSLYHISMIELWHNFPCPCACYRLLYRWSSLSCDDVAMVFYPPLSVDYGGYPPCACDCLRLLFTASSGRVRAWKSLVMRWCLRWLISPRCTCVYVGIAYAWANSPKWGHIFSRGDSNQNTDIHRSTYPVPLFFPLRWSALISLFY